MRILKSMTPVYSQSYFLRGVKKLIRDNFKENGRFRIDSYRNKYRPRYDPEIFGMKHGTVSEVADIYFNNEYLCEVNEKMKPNEALAQIEYNLLLFLR
jgi:hypothetical protein